MSVESLITNNDLKLLNIIEYCLTAIKTLDVEQRIHAIKCIQKIIGEFKYE